MNKTDVSCRIISWLLLLQESDIIIIDKQGKNNVVANFLFRLTHVADKETIDDAFSDEHLFSISIHTPWLAYIANY